MQRHYGMWTRYFGLCIEWATGWKTAGSSPLRSGGETAESKAIKKIIPLTFRLSDLYLCLFASILLHCTTIHFICPFYRQLCPPSSRPLTLKLFPFPGSSIPIFFSYLCFCHSPFSILLAYVLYVYILHSSFISPCPNSGRKQFTFSTYPASDRR